MRFVANGMLGKLARWLRLAGYDVIYMGRTNLPPEGQDERILETVNEEGGVLLTADVQLHRRALRQGLRSVLIRETEVAGQLAEISRRLGERIEIIPEKSRCSVCNGTLTPVAKDTVEGMVPEKVLMTNDFWRCTNCGKIYWRGKHWKNITEEVNKYNDLLK
ncbi:MAG: Mut7-C RNAse domain-containing protein [Candidatus Hadarchaeum sp.]|uniref:Mut7-C RNAse domain-containing protein n=1 Tax=Candidatus Hadarchaeum sp. TaxID=2883567 RepID=UPI003D0E9A0F